jgi:hypothetical protein
MRRVRLRKRLKVVNLVNSQVNSASAISTSPASAMHTP